MNGIFCLNKPQGFTSFDAVAKLRGILHMRKIGHAGTLDPMATGVLPIFLGTAAKACDMMPDNGKAYLASFKLGLETDTQDIYGKVISYCGKKIAEEDILKILPDFSGETEQLPPMFSAVSIKGKRLYEYARQGITVEREKRKIKISSIELVKYDGEKGEGSLFIDCSKGTYVRTVIHDMGQALGCGGVMTALVRQRSNGFTLDDCLSFDEVAELSARNEMERRVIPVDKVFEHLPELILSEKQTYLYKNGVKISAGDPGEFRVYTFDGRFLGIASAEPDEMLLRVKKNFWA